MVSSIICGIILFGCIFVFLFWIFGDDKKSHHYDIFEEHYKNYLDDEGEYFSDQYNGYDEDY